MAQQALQSPHKATSWETKVTGNGDKRDGVRQI